MSTTALVILIAIAAVGIFVLAMSLTMIFKGHHIDSEIGDNRHMKERGIKCASQQIREEERALKGDDPDKNSCDAICDDHDCRNCGTH